MPIISKRGAFIVGHQKESSRYIQLKKGCPRRWVSQPGSKKEKAKKKAGSLGCASIGSPGIGEGSSTPKVKVQREEESKKREAKKISLSGQSSSISCPRKGKRRSGPLRGRDFEWTMARLAQGFGGGSWRKKEGVHLIGKRIIVWTHAIPFSIV